MADFEDMTGWREELEAWCKSEDYKNRPALFHPPYPPVPLTKVLKFIELEHANPECQAAHAAITAWQTANPDKYSWEDEENFPHFASSIIVDFLAWFLWKVDIDVAGSAFSRALDVARKIREGEFSSVDSPDVIVFLREKCTDKIIDFDS